MVHSRGFCAEANARMFFCAARIADCSSGAVDFHAAFISSRETSSGALGGKVEDRDRVALREKTAGWREQIASGAMTSEAAMLVLGKIAVALGPEGYNRFVDGYNNGTAVAK